jgi:hypothetical protein
MSDGRRPLGGGCGIVAYRILGLTFDRRRALLARFL